MKNAVLIFAFASLACSSPAPETAVPQQGEASSQAVVSQTSAIETSTTATSAPPVAEAPVVEETAAVQKPSTEKPAGEKPVTETPVAETPKPVAKPEPIRHTATQDALTEPQMIALLKETGFILEGGKKEVIAVTWLQQTERERIDLRFTWRKLPDGKPQEAKALLRKLIKGWTVMEVTMVK